MEENLEAPLEPQEIADSVGLTTRRLERLFRRKLNDSPARYYLKIRLQAARNLLFYSDVPIQNVALSCGFSGAEVFSRTFAAISASPRGSSAATSAPIACTAFIRSSCSAWANGDDLSQFPMSA